VAILLDPRDASHAAILQSVRVMAEKLRVNILQMQARSSQEIGNAFSLMRQKKADAVLVVSGGLFPQHVRQIAVDAEKQRLPSISSWREYAEAGGLLSYGQNLAQQFRCAATYVDKIFRGAKPADLPVELPTHFDFFINGKTAKALSLTIPQSLMVMATKVIE
jgi:putative ABC transport system substrate-binding protein